MNAMRSGSESWSIPSQSRPAAIAAQDLAAGKPIRADQIRVENVDGAPFGESPPEGF